MVFIGRERELERLESIHSGDGLRTVMVYGRRQVGKSTLLRRFCEGKRALYIQSPQGSAADVLHNLALSISAFDGREREDYRFVQDAFEDLALICREEATVLILDEFQFMTGSIDSASSVLQRFLDLSIQGTRTMLVICGSSVSMMRREVEDYNRPLYGRIHHRMEVRPLPFAECVGFHPDLPDADQMMLYLTVGGMPRYHSLGGIRSYRDYVIEHFLSDNADLRDEADILIAAELSPRGRYISIVNAISGGCTSHKRIHERVGIDRTTCTGSLANLVSVGIVDIVHPMMGSPKNPVYRISDNIVAFCKEVAAYADTVPLMDAESKYDYLEQRIRSFLGHRFEDLCTEYVVGHHRCLEIGRWWGPDGSGQIREIDIAATVLEGDVKVSLFGDCKFIKDAYRMSTLRHFRESVDLIGDDRTQRILLFSVSGFSQEVEDEADMGHVTLVGPDELMGRSDPSR